MMRRLLCVLLMALLVSTAALADDFGQTYDGFVASYADNITLLNQSTGRMLLPHSLQRDYDLNSKRFYRINSGSLSAEIHMDESGQVISRCQIILTAPDGMRHGDSLYADFTVSAYHSYALIMAMHKAPTAYERYALVQQVESAMAQSDTYETAVGDYRLTCTRVGQTASFVFENALFLPADPIVPDEDDAGEEEEDALIG